MWRRLGVHTAREGGREKPARLHLSSCLSFEHSAGLWTGWFTENTCTGETVYMVASVAQSEAVGGCVSKVRGKSLCQKQPHRRGSLNHTQDGETRLGGNNSCGPYTRTPDTNYIRQTAQPPGLIPSVRRKASDSLSIIKKDAIFRVFQMPFMRLGKLFSISGLLGVSVFGCLTISRCSFYTY